jgi:hypothetical protein
MTPSCHVHMADNYVPPCAGPVLLQVVCPYRCIEERAMPLKQMGDLGQVRKCNPYTM